MHPRILKELAEVICTPLTIIFNASMELGVLPADWKPANITPIYKKGKKQVAGNYRPVSLTSILCKVLESIVRDQIVNYMKENKLFSKKQFGFIGGRSTTLQLLKVLDKWTSILDRGGAVDVVYFDFMKALDKVPHGRLILKLRSYGIDSKPLSWIQDFLTERKQRVVVNGEKSLWSAVTSGVPQGSVLGPVLFVIYINDLPDVIDAGSNMDMFADDTKLYREIKQVADRHVMQSDVDAMDGWSEDWLMKYHPAKCKVMKMGKLDAEDLGLSELFEPYTLQGHHLETVDQE